MDVYVLPVLNPDGYLHTWTSVGTHKNVATITWFICQREDVPNRLCFSSQNRMWRKNRSVREGSSCVGVDLNRNFDANWCSEYTVVHIDIFCISCARIHHEFY